MYDVITIGTATRDVFLRSPLFKVLRDPEHLKKIGFPAGEAQCFALGGKIEVEERVSTTGGGATNAAVTFSRQGLKTAAVIKIGPDETGENIIRELKKEKVKPLAIRDKKSSTASSTILLAPNGERTILIYRGASEDLRKKEIPLFKLKARWVYIAPGRIAFPLINDLISHFYKLGTAIAIDLSRNLIEKRIKGLTNILGKAKMVKMNREEAAYLTDINYQNVRGIFKKLDQAVRGIAVMTDGPQGVMVSDGFNLYKTAIFKEKRLMDRTGAGDAFGSGFVAGLIQKKEQCEKGLCELGNIEYAIRLGSANATSVIEHIGAQEGILTKKEFEKSRRWQKLPIKIIRI